MIQNVEGVRTDLETHPFVYADALRQRHVQLREQWAIDRTPRQSPELAGTIVKEHLTRKRRLAKRRRSAAVGVNHRRIDVVDDAVLNEDADEVTDLSIRQISLGRLVCGSAHAVQRTSRIDDRQWRAGVDA